MSHFKAFTLQNLETHSLPEVIDIIDQIASENATNYYLFNPNIPYVVLPELRRAAASALLALLEIRDYLLHPVSPVYSFQQQSGSVTASLKSTLSEGPKQAKRRCFSRSLSPHVAHVQTGFSEAHSYTGRAHRRYEVHSFKTRRRQLVKDFERSFLENPPRTAVSYPHTSDSSASVSKPEPSNSYYKYVSPTCDEQKYFSPGGDNIDLTAIRLFSQASLEQHEPCVSELPSTSIFPKCDEQSVNDTPSSDVELTVPNAETVEPSKKTFHHHYYHYDEMFDDEEAIIPGTQDNESSIAFYNRLHQQEALEIETRRLAKTYEEQTSKECVTFVLSLCVPFLSSEERISKMALLSRDCYVAAMERFPTLSVDFCSSDTEHDLTWLPAFIRHVAPKLSNTLVSARINCSEHLLLVGAIGFPLKELTLCNVPLASGSSSLLSIQLQDAATASEHLLDKKSHPKAVCDAALLLAPLRPLSGWLHALANRCPNLEFLSIEFNSELPFVMSGGTGPHHNSTSLPPTLLRATRHFTVYPSSCSRIAALFYKGLTQRFKRVLQMENVRAYLAQQGLLSLMEPPNVSDSLNRKNETESSVEPLINMNLSNLKTLEILEVGSLLPLTLLFGVGCKLKMSFPQLTSFVISTTPSFSTTNLTEFLILFGLLVLNSSKNECYNKDQQQQQQHMMLQTLAIHHSSNIANFKLLESLRTFCGLKSLRLTSNSSFGNNVILNHSNIVHLEITIHANLLWCLELPSLRRLKLLVSSYQTQNSSLLDLNKSLDLRNFLNDILSKSSGFSELEILSSDNVVLKLQGRDKIENLVQNDNEW